MLAGVIAEKLADKYVEKPNPDEIYLMAALANIGKVVEAICLPEETDQVFIIVKKEKMSWDRAERKSADLVIAY